MLPIITSIDDELLRNVNIDDLEWPWTLKILILCDFLAIFGWKRVNCDEMNEDRLRLLANRNCHKLLRVSWALAQISCWHLCENLLEGSPVSGGGFASETWSFYNACKNFGAKHRVGVESRFGCRFGWVGFGLKISEATKPKFTRLSSSNAGGIAVDKVVVWLQVFLFLSVLSFIRLSNLNGVLGKVLANFSLYSPKRLGNTLYCVPLAQKGTWLGASAELRLIIIMIKDNWKGKKNGYFSRLEANGNYWKQIRKQ